MFNVQNRLLTKKSILLLNTKHLPLYRNQNLILNTMNTKLYKFEIYTNHPETMENGWDIEIVQVVADNRIQAKEFLKQWNLFDCVITNEGVYDYEILSDKGKIFDSNSNLLFPIEAKGKTLNQKLREQTSELKRAYSLRMREYAIQFYNLCLKRSKFSDSDWCEYFGITPILEKDYKQREYLTFPRKFYNTSDARRLNSIKNDMRKTLSSEVDTYIDKQIKIGEDYYEKCLLKLESRLNKKGISDSSEISITNENIGINFHMTIKHGDKIIKAWTIIAEGEIQRPHYRYLVK